MSASPSCPLCGGRVGPSWFGATRYAGRVFDYLECRVCGTLSCSPMPDADVLRAMYGPEYNASVAVDDVDARQRQRVAAWLQRTSPGRFIDYGCGHGRLLEDAARLGWEAIGIEFDDEVAQAVSARCGLQVMTERAAQDDIPSGFADVLHVGDVIEHLTDPAGAMTRLLSLVKPGGLLIAKGPLEANPNLFTLGLRVARRMRGRRPAAMPPYHVLLATAVGQRRFFERLGLRELEYRLEEVAWPAPDSLAPSDWRRPRAIALFLLRRGSRAISRLRPAAWGNRYFYVGQNNDKEQHT